MSNAANEICDDIIHPFSTDMQVNNDIAIINHVYDVFNESSTSFQETKSSTDIQASNEFVIINPVYEILNESSTIAIETKKGAAQWFVPINSFKGLHYSPSNKHMCHGTLAFHCKKMAEDKNYKIYQSWCPTCRNEWEGIHKDESLIGKAHVNYRYKLIPLWRYGVEMGKLL